MEAYIDAEIVDETPAEETKHRFTRKAALIVGGVAGLIAGGLLTVLVTQTEDDAEDFAEYDDITIDADTIIIED